MSNPQSPEPSRWILEMFAPDIPAWYRAFNELERKPLKALEDTLVHSFDRYLHRKGYLTKRQVEVLENIAKKHKVPLPRIPPLSRHSKSAHTTQDPIALLRQIRIPELEIRENARWLALLIDTEGALGWRRYARGRNRIDERWKYWYAYRIPYISLAMLETESKRTVEQGARLIGVKPRTTTVNTAPIRRFDVFEGRALSVMRYMKPYQDKFARLTNLCLTMFKHHTLIPQQKFDKVIQTLFVTYLTPKETNHTLLTMTKTQYRQLLKKAKKLTDTYLKRPWKTLTNLEFF